MAENIKHRTLDHKVPPVMVLIIIAVFIYLAGLLAPELNFNFDGKIYLSLLIVVAGFWISAAGVLTFGQADTTVNPLEPEKASELITTGIYSRSRNPMYLGMFLALCGWGIWQANVLSLFVLPLFIIYINRYQIEPEERALHRIFGKEFESYKRSVRRWL